MQGTYTAIVTMIIYNVILLTTIKLPILLLLVVFITILIQNIFLEILNL